MSQKTSFSIQNLSLDRIEDILFLSEDAARKYIQSHIPSKELKTFNISIEFNSDESTIDCEIDLELNPQSKLDPKKLNDEAIQKIFSIIEREIQKHSN